MVNLTVSCSYLSLLMVVVSSNIIMVGQFLYQLYNLASHIFDHTCQSLTRCTTHFNWAQTDRDNIDIGNLCVRRYMCSKLRHYEEAVECAVCLCKIEEWSEIRELRCDHWFHRVCLDRWMGYRHRTCPLCRDSLSLAPCRGLFPNELEVVVFKFGSLDSSGTERWWLR